jgi:hypothetical protein
MTVTARAVALIGASGIGGGSSGECNCETITSKAQYSLGPPLRHLLLTHAPPGSIFHATFSWPGLHAKPPQGPSSEGPTETARRAGQAVLVHHGRQFDAAGDRRSVVAGFNLAFFKATTRGCFSRSLPVGNDTKIPVSDDPISSVSCAPYNWTPA